MVKEDQNKIYNMSIKFKNNMENNIYNLNKKVIDKENNSNARLNKLNDNIKQIYIRKNNKFKVKYKESIENIEKDMDNFYEK